MLILLLFAFIAGVVTILSPCILPILPIVLSGSVGGGKRKPLGIVSGFVLSFTFFTLFLSTLVNLLNISADSLRSFSIVIIFVFGLSLVLPFIQSLIEQLFSKISGRLSPKQQQNDGFLGGVLIGLSLGLLWTPCVGPILASVISLALTGSVDGFAFMITLAYSLGTAIPMLLIIYTGRTMFTKIPWLLSKTKQIQQVFGIVMMLTAVGLYLNVDRKFQTYILETFPQYGAGLTAIEDNEAVKNQLDQLRNNDMPGDNIGKPLFQLRDNMNFPEAPELQSQGEWFNSAPLTLQQLQSENKVVLVDFWTYSCINCIRTLPYLRTWHEKYVDEGLVIIGVHAPEFEFEKSAKNVQEAITDFELKYPIVQDNEFQTWRAYNNRFWPAKYLIDKNGKIRYTHFGEGKYDETEQMIQDLLNEAGNSISSPISNSTYDVSAQTPELYLGAKRMELLANEQTYRLGEPQGYKFSQDLALHFFEYDGDWAINEEFSAPLTNAKLKLRFSAKQVFLVMRTKDGSPAQVGVFFDGKPVDQQSAGKDIHNGFVTVEKDRLYDLIEIDQQGEHLLELQFLNNNVEIFAFTFG